MVALATSALAVVQTNSLQWGGDARDTRWDANWVTNSSVSPTEYSISLSPPLEYTELSNLKFTVTFTETNGMPLLAAANWLAATSDGGVDDRRLNSNDVLRLKVSYSDPDNVLLGLGVSEIGAELNTTDPWETTIFSVGATSYTISNSNALVDYALTGLTPLTTNNVNTWEMLVSVQDYGTNLTSSAMGGFALKYIADSAYVPPPVTVPVVFTFPNSNGLDSVGVGGTITYSDITITTIDVIGQDLSKASEGTGNTMNTTSANNLGVNSVLNIWGTDDARDFDPNEAWVFSFNTNVYLIDFDFAGWGTTLPSAMTLSSPAFVSNIVFSGISANGTFTLPENTYIAAGTEVKLQMSSETNSALYDIATRISYLTVAAAPSLADPTTYAYWATSKNLTKGVNDGYGDDPEADGMDNLLEYALGADPLVDDAASFLPGYALSADGGSNYFNYVYRRRIDYEARGLSYAVRSSADLVYDPMVNATTEVGSGAIDAEFESVTNRVSTAVKPQQFMQLKVTDTLEE